MTGREFRRWRRNSDITQEEVASACNINKSIISRWENDLFIISEKNYIALMRFMNSTKSNEAFE